jgi:transcription elongation GreA/GreB family factor
MVFLQSNMTFKQKIYNHYLQLVNDKVNMLQQVLADLKESSSNETKSTAGDKHETALAMLQIEEANTRTQLQEVLNQKAVLEKIDPGIAAAIIVNGSLVKTDKGYLFMSVALGKAVIDNIAVIALSAQSPLGQKLMGLKPGDHAAIHDMQYKVENIE